MNDRKEPKIDWQLEFMKLAKVYVGTMLTVYETIPGYEHIRRCRSEEHDLQRIARENEETRYIFQRYGIEQTKENVQKFKEAQYDYYGECLDGYDDEKYSHTPAHPTHTMFLLYSLDWSGLVKNKKMQERLETDIAEGINLPGDTTKFSPGETYPLSYQPDRSELVYDGVEWLKLLASMNVFNAHYYDTPDKLTPSLHKHDMVSELDFGLFGMYEVKEWLAWYNKVNSPSA